MDDNVKMRVDLLTAIFFVLFFVCAAPSMSGAIRCFCEDHDRCPNFTCLADTCFARATLAIGHPQVESPLVRRSYGCWQGGPGVCNTTNTTHTILCCEDADNCNGQLVPMLAGESTSTTVSIPVSPLLRPHPPSSPAPSSTDSEETTTSTTTQSSSSGSNTSSDSCFESDSENSDSIRLCSLVSTCFTTIRRAPNGTVLRTRRGCSTTPCMQEDRNRKTKICCTSSLCNTLDPGTEPASSTTQPHTPSPVTASPITPSTPHTSTTYEPPTLNSIQPITDSPGPPTPPPLFFCTCSTSDCENIFCNSSFGCFTNVTAKGTIRGCVTKSTDCLFNSVCCVSGSFCNGQPPRSTRPPTTYPTDKPNSSTSTDNRSTSTSSKSDTETVPLPTKNSPHSTNSDIYYIIGTVIVVFFSLVILSGLGLAGIIFYCCRKSSSSSKVVTLNKTDSSKDTLRQITIIRDSSPSSSPTTDSHASSLTPMNPYIGTSV